MNNYVKPAVSKQSALPSSDWDIASMFATPPLHTDVLRCQNLPPYPVLGHATEVEQLTYHIQRYALAYRVLAFSQHWLSDKQRTDRTYFFGMFEYLYNASNSIIQLEDNNAVPWQPLAHWLDSFKIPVNDRS